VIDVTQHTFSRRSNWRRFRAHRGMIHKRMNLERAVSSEGRGRLAYYRTVRGLLDSDRQFRAYFERETDVLPPFFTARLKKDLGALWDHLPEGALEHDMHAYMNSMPAAEPAEVVAV
jgi:hypothetical protein